MNDDESYVLAEDEEVESKSLRSPREIRNASKENNEDENHDHGDHDHGES